MTQGSRELHCDHSAGVVVASVAFPTVLAEDSGTDSVIYSQTGLRA